MTVKAFATEKTSHETIATAVAVMDALQSSPDSFTKHSTISKAHTHSDGVYAFIPLMTGIAKPMDLSVQKGTMSPIAFTIGTKDNILGTINNSIPTTRGNNKSSNLKPKQ